MCTVTAIAEGITSIKPAGKAEKAAAAKSEALVPWAQGMARHKVEKFLREDKHIVMIHPNFSHPFPSPLRPHLLQHMHQHQHQPYNQFQPSQ